MGLKSEIEAFKRSKIAPPVVPDTSQSHTAVQFVDNSKELDRQKQHLQAIASESGLMGMVQEAHDALINTGVPAPSVDSKLITFETGDIKSELTISLNWTEWEGDSMGKNLRVAIDILDNGDIGIYLPQSYLSNLFNRDPRKIIHRTQWEQDRSILEKNLLLAIQNPSEENVYPAEWDGGSF